MWSRIACLVLTALPGAAWSWSPLGEVVCGLRPALVERLERQQGARLHGLGLRDRDTVLEVWAAPDGGWTMVQSYADGRACIVAMGAHWDGPRPPA